MSVEEAAGIIGVTARHVRLLLKDQKIEGERVGKRTWLVKRGSAEAFAATQRHAGGRPRKRREGDDG